MPTAPKADPPRCDVTGCGSLASMMSDGTEVDTAVKRVAEGKDEPIGRKALPYLNVCDHHKNWIFSEDAKSFSIGNSAYDARAARR